MISRTIFQNKLELLECTKHANNTVQRVNLAKKADKFFYCPQCLIEEGFNLENIKSDLHTIDHFVDTLYSGGATVLAEKLDQQVSQVQSFKREIAGINEEFHQSIDIDLKSLEESVVS
jgi:uncharacterized protein YlzI (FlbEa/FlbD family)